MNLRPNNDITAGDSSHNNQAGTINNHYHTGITLNDAKDLFTILFKDNFMKLRDEAAQIAESRATVITDKFLDKIQSEDESVMKELGTPGLQDAFYNAQKEFAISGEEHLGDMLVQLLIERASMPEKNRQRAVLDETLKIVPKLTSNQMDLLTINHFTNRVKYKVEDFDSLCTYFNRVYMLLEHIDPAQINHDLKFLEYLGLGKSIHLGKYPDFNVRFRTNYPAFMMRGFSIDDIHMPELKYDDILTDCCHNSDGHQIKYTTKEVFIEVLKSKSMTDERINYFCTFWDNYLMTDDEFLPILHSNVPNLQKLFDIHQETLMQSFELNPVGAAIALSNYQRIYNYKLDLSIWVK